MTTALFQILLFTGILVPLCTAIGPEKQLVQDLLQNYGKFPKSGRPVEDPNQPISVKIGVALNQILLINQDAQFLDCVATTILEWEDFQLTWDPASSDNITQLSLETGLIWTPDIVLINGLGPMTAFHPEYALVGSDGKISVSTTRKFRTSCKANPGDTTQSCKLVFSSNTQNQEQLDLREAHGRMYLYNFLSNNDWELLTTQARTEPFQFECCQDKKYSMVTFTINVKARPKEEEKKEEVQDSHGNYVALDRSLLLLTNLVILLFTSL